MHSSDRSDKRSTCLLLQKIRFSKIARGVTNMHMGVDYFK
jgi:hypothetical protein